MKSDERDVKDRARRFYDARHGISQEERQAMDNEKMGRAILEMRKGNEVLHAEVVRLRALKDAYIKEDIVRDIASIFSDAGLSREDAVDFLTTAPASFSWGDVDERIKQLGGHLPYGDEEEE